MHLMNGQDTAINWFPGHMAKSRRLLQDQVKRTDLVIELCDARLPFSSRNPELNRMVQNKRRILFLNKADLADPSVTRKWLTFFKTAGLDVWQTNSQMLHGKETIAIIDRATREIVDRAMEKGVRKTVRAMVIGVPNVGKSTMINRLYGGSVTRTGDKPGVTRSSQWVRISPYLELLDTPGMLWPRLDDQDAARRLCYIGSVRDEAVDLYSLTISLLEELMQICPDKVADRFHLISTESHGTDLLDDVCRGRGWLLKGSRSDYDRCCNIVLDEFRSGKLGKISLESPAGHFGETQEEMNGHD